MGLKRENHMIIMILWSGLSHNIFYTLFLQSSLTQIMPRLHIAYSFKAGVTSTLCLWRRSRYYHIQTWNLIIFHNCWLEIILKILEILVSSIHSLRQVQQLSATKAFARNNLHVHVFAIIDLQSAMLDAQCSNSLKTACFSTCLKEKWFGSLLHYI